MKRVNKKMFCCAVCETMTERTMRMIDQGVRAFESALSGMEAYILEMQLKEEDYDCLMEHFYHCREQIKILKGE